MMLSVLIFLACYALIVTEKFNKTIIVLVGAAAAILLHQIDSQEAFAKVDLNVVFLLIGMMMIVNILALSGVFEWTAITLAKKSRGNGMFILFAFVILTAVLSSFLDNVTTVILIAPITILITQILEMPTVPFLILEAIFSNIGGTATLIGDPPNILIGSQAGLTFNEFLVNLSPVIILITLASAALLFLTFRKKAQTRESARALIMKADPQKAIINPMILRRGLPIFGLVLVGFFLAHVLDIEPGIIALVGAFLMAGICRIHLHEVMGKVEWETILFFIGLFMLIGALEVKGVFEFLGHEMVALTKGQLLLTALSILWVSALASAVVDNIPLVIAMIPLINTIIPEFAQSMGIAGDPAAIHSQIKAPLFWSLALGACLGGNGTLIGASANVVISQIAHRNNYKLSFLDFTRQGAVYMLLSLLISSAYIALRYF
ncbi:MAG: ArsB/NhaD family transporter [Lentisphaeria bacterium]|jgi:Na+/H+ antiporter NhaD/arsenite permease-like protein